MGVVRFKIVVDGSIDASLEQIPEIGNNQKNNKKGLGIAYFTKNIEVSGRKVSAILFDLSGSAKNFNRFRERVYKDARAIILVGEDIEYHIDLARKWNIEPLLVENISENFLNSIIKRTYDLILMEKTGILENEKIIQFKNKLNQLKEELNFLLALRQILEQSVKPFELVYFLDHNSALSEEQKQLFLKKYILGYVPIPENYGNLTFINELDDSFKVTKFQPQLLRNKIENSIIKVENTIENIKKKLIEA